MSAVHPASPTVSAPRYFGTTIVTRWPSRASARGSAVLTSASPPVLPNGRASEVTNRMSRASPAGVRSVLGARAVRGVLGVRGVLWVRLVRAVRAVLAAEVVFFAMRLNCHCPMRRLSNMPNLRWRALAALAFLVVALGGGAAWWFRR